MSQDIDFPDFPYLSITYVHPNEPMLNTLLYPSFLERWMSKIEFIADSSNPLPARFGNCRGWISTGSKTPMTLTHKYRGNLNAQTVSWALQDPKEVTRLLRRRRLPRITYTTVCGRPGCMNPLHIHPSGSLGPWYQVQPPRKRRPGKRNDEWLTMPEMVWLRYRMMTSFNSDLGDVLTQISEEIDMHFTTLVSIWNTMVDLDRRYFFETFVVKGEHRHGND